MEKTMAGSFRQKMRGRVPGALWWAAVAGLILLQLYLFTTRFPLSLGPRVILQPWLIQQGRVMYEDLVDMHSPLMPMLLALLRWGIPDGLALAKTVLAALFSAGLMLTALTAKRLAGAWAGLWAAALMALWSLDFGFAKLWHESFLALVYIVWIAWLVFFFDRKTWWRLPAMGLIAGVGILFKQHALIVFAGFLVWYALCRRREAAAWRSVAADTFRLCFWTAVPGLAFLVCQYLRAGTLSGFFYWAIVFNFTSDYVELGMQAPAAADWLRFGTIFAFLPIVLGCLWDAFRTRDRSAKFIGAAVLFMACTAATQYPRFGSFHFQPWLPLLTLTYGWTAGYLVRAAFRFRITIVIGLAGLTVFWFSQTGLKFGIRAEVPAAPSVSEYSSLLPVADRIRPFLHAGASLYIFPDDESTSNLYYLLGIEPAGLWVFHYPWYMTDSVRRELADMFRERPPEFVVFRGDAWDMDANAPEVLAAIRAGYQPVAAIPWSGGEMELLARKIR
jgi:hypothetical protein